MKLARHGKRPKLHGFVDISVIAGLGRLLALVAVCTVMALISPSFLTLSAT